MKTDSSRREFLAALMGSSAAMMSARISGAQDLAPARSIPDGLLKF